MASVADPVPHTEAQHRKLLWNFIFISKKLTAVPAQKRIYRIKAQATSPPLPSSTGTLWTREQGPAILSKKLLVSHPKFNCKNGALTCTLMNLKESKPT